MQAPVQDARPWAVTVANAQVTAAGQPVGLDLERLSVATVGALRAVGVVVAVDDPGRVAGGSDGAGREIERRGEVGDFGGEDLRAGRADEQDPVNAEVAVGLVGVVQPDEHGE